MGIFGGTFDPIHYGHLRTAFEMLQALRFDEVRFMPCGNPPHRAAPVAAADLRLDMVSVATEAQHGFVVDDRELQRDGPSYSVDTLSALRSEFPLRPIGLIIGMDAFLSLPKWYHWRKILAACTHRGCTSSRLARAGHGAIGRITWRSRHTPHR